MIQDLPGSFPYQPTAFPGPYQYTGDLPLGRWSMMANGRIFELRIAGVQNATVNASLSSGRVEDATWTGFANASTLAELSFVRVLPDLRLKQRFHGYLLHYSESDPLWRIAGTFGDIKKKEPEAGWYATLPRL